MGKPSEVDYQAVCQAIIAEPGWSWAPPQGTCPCGLDVMAFTLQKSSLVVCPGCLTTALNVGNSRFMPLPTVRPGRQCRQCHREGPLEDFVARTTGALTVFCGQCRSAWGKAKREEEARVFTDRRGTMVDDLRRIEAELLAEA